MVTIRQGDCIELMQDIPNASVDFILRSAIRPTTQCAWDVLIPFAKWEHAQKEIRMPPNQRKRRDCVILCAEPFGSALRMITSKITSMNGFGTREFQQDF